MAILNNSNAISSGGYDINNSLRFRSSANAFLNRTPSVAGSGTTFTLSAWVKRGKLGANQAILCTSAVLGTNVSVFEIDFTSSDTLEIFAYSAPTTNLNIITTQVFRDPSAWYHIVVVADTTQATAANRIKIYVNGTQVTAFGTATYPSQNFNCYLNSTIPTLLGMYAASGYPSLAFDGYLAEVNLIDGQALTPSSFGETDTTTGSWKPKAYTGTYGTNGFYLKFSDIATTSGSNAGLGKDFSGNANYWTTNNISVTSGTTYDAMIDSPTNTSATVANYAVLNPLDTSIFPNPTISNGNLTVTNPSSANRNAKATMQIPSGKFYWEMTLNSAPTSNGLSIAINYGSTLSYYNPNSGQIYINNSLLGTYATATTNDVLAIAVDRDANTVSFYKNNTLLATGTGLSAGDMLPNFFTGNINDTFNVNFGQRPFVYTPPTGFVRLNTFNLPDSTIKAGNSGFGVLTYTGNGSTSVTRSDTNAVNFTPDFVWIKSRSSTNFHNLYDVNRIVSGDHKRLYSNATNAEESSTFSGATNLNGFVSGGFTTGSGGDTNTNAATYVAWCWDANGSPVSNTSGTITSTVSVNATAGFSVVTYTGTGSNATVGHGLGVAPSWIIVKGRSGAGALNWMVYQKTMTATSYNYLNLTNAKETSSVLWNNTEPTSTVFSLGSNANVNNSTSPYVAYCWAEIAGFSKFGSYTGNGSADGPFIFTGFRPKWLMIKRTDTTQNWIIVDTSRDTYNITNKRLFANLSDAEDTGIPNYVDLLSNGFKCRDSNISYNASGGTYIVMAFAENPLKNSLAR